jgi:hypothetical protein
MYSPSQILHLTLLITGPLYSSYFLAQVMQYAVRLQRPQQFLKGTSQKLQGRQHFHYLLQLEMLVAGEPDSTSSNLLRTQLADLSGSIHYLDTAQESDFYLPSRALLKGGGGGGGGGGRGGSSTTTYKGTTPSSTTESNLDAGYVVLIAMGSILLSISFICYCYCINRRQKRTKAEETKAEAVQVGKLAA